MIVGVLTVRLHIPGARSLKDRRRAVRSVKDRLRSRFNVSVAEIGAHDIWQTADVAVCGVGNDRAVVEKLLLRILDMMRSDHRVELMRHDLDFV
jgi:hypothetical protein